MNRKKIQEELIVEHQKAEESSRLKSSLLANMSHEFRTPMNSILGFSQFLKDHLQDTEFKNLAGMINISGKRLLKTLNAIVDLARLEADKKPPNIEEINLSELVRKIIMDFREHAEKKGIVIIEQIDPNTCSMFNNSFASLIITNLIDNAIKFTNEGSVQVILKKEEVANTAKVVFIVRDTGIGIPSEFHERIFDDFRQVSEGMGRFYEGLGIGLSLSKKLLSMLNGEIRLESEVGKGTVFYVKFPSYCYDESSIKISGATDTTALKPVNDSGIKTMNEALTSVLVVEDNEQNQELVELFLKPHHIITQAYDGESALKLAMEHHFDVVLMDINLGPGMDGITTMKKIKEHEINAKVPVIAVTGYTNMDEKQKLLAQGFNSFLPKPYSKMGLIGAIREVIIS